MGEDKKYIIIAQNLDLTGKLIVKDTKSKNDWSILNGNSVTYISDCMLSRWISRGAVEEYNPVGIEEDQDLDFTNMSLIYV